MPFLNPTSVKKCADVKSVKEAVKLIMNLDISLRFGAKLAMFHFEPFFIDFIVNYGGFTIYQ